MHNIKSGKIAAGMKLFLFLLLAFALAVGVCDFITPDSVSVFAGEDIPSYFIVDIDGDKPECAGCSSRNAEILGIIPLKKVDVKVYENIKLYPGGIPFGVKLYTKGVLAVGFSEFSSGGAIVSPAYNAGLRIKDVITGIDGREINTAEALSEAVKTGNGAPMTITYTRGGESFELSVTPMAGDDGEFKIGMWVRDSTAGIGTVTFVNPKTGAFAGLGHGICDTDTGELLPLLKGTVNRVTVSGIKKGESGAPGELRGSFGTEKIGALIGNTEVGVFGLLSDIPASLPEKALPIGLSGDLREGKAYIYCTPNGSTPRKFEIEISKINRNGDTATKSFTVRVTDKELLELTGGIVQGMSGSPIIQNGKLIGAVTHVLINDPTCGYGIFIENMLDGMNDSLK